MLKPGVTVTSRGVCSDSWRPCEWVAATLPGAQQACLAPVDSASGSFPGLRPPHLRPVPAACDFLSSSLFQRTPPPCAVPDMGQLQLCLQPCLRLPLLPDPQRALDLRFWLVSLACFPQGRGRPHLHQPHSGEPASLCAWWHFS